MSALSRLRFSKSLFAAALCIVVLCSVGLPNAHAQLFGTIVGGVENESTWKNSLTNVPPHFPVVWRIRCTD